MVGAFIHLGVLIVGLAVWAVLALAESKRIVSGAPRRSPIFRRSSRAILVFVVGLALIAGSAVQPYLFVAAIAVALVGNA